MTDFDPRRMYSMKEVAEICQVDISTSWRWTLYGVKGCRLVSRLIGGRRRVTQAALDAFFAAINNGQSDDNEAPPQRSANEEAIARELSRRNV